MPYNPNQPRDRHGRWTTGGTAAFTVGIVVEGSVALSGPGGGVSAEVGAAARTKARTARGAPTKPVEVEVEVSVSDASVTIGRVTVKFPRGGADVLSVPNERLRRLSFPVEVKNPGPGSTLFMGHEQVLTTSDGAAYLDAKTGKYLKEGGAIRVNLCISGSSGRHSRNVDRVL